MQLYDAIFTFLGAHPWLYVFVIWPVCTFIINLFLRYKPQELEWIEKHPRLAGVLMVLQAGGFDPWGWAAGMKALLAGKLPKKADVA